MEPAEPMTPAPAPEPSEDCRLYVPETDNWTARILKGWDQVYCFSKNPGEEFYHLILHGEIYIQNGDEVYCLSCGLRDGLLTKDRLFWQNRTG